MHNPTLSTVLSLRKPFTLHTLPAWSAESDFAPDLICFSHLRWNFVFQRPQHLLSRFAGAIGRVFYFEEPVFGEESSYLKIERKDKNLYICTPYLLSNNAVDQDL